MASPISIGGVQILAPDQGDTFLWGAFVKTALAQVAVSCLQTTGGSFPLTADLNLGSSFGLIAPYYKSAAATIASAGILRLAKTDTLGWRNTSNSADAGLFMGTGGGNATDQIYWSDGTHPAVQLSGNPYFRASITTAQTGISAAQTVKFDNVTWDSDTGYNTGTGLYTVPANKGGWYFAAVDLGFIQQTGAGQVSVNICIDGGPLGGVSTPGTIGAGISARLGAGLGWFMTAGHTISVQLSTSANTVNTVAADALSSFTVFRTPN